MVEEGHHGILVLGREPAFADELFGVGQVIAVALGRNSRFLAGVGVRQTLFQLVVFGLQRGLLLRGHCITLLARGFSGGSARRRMLGVGESGTRLIVLARGVADVFDLVIRIAWSAVA